MAKIKLNGDTSGYIEISAPAVSGNNTLELGPGTRILTNLDNTFTGISTFSNGIDVTGGNLDIGGATHSRNLTVHDATNSVILIEGASNGTSNLMFADENDEDVGMLGYNHASNYLAFTVNAAERLRIFSTGQIGMGKAGAVTPNGNSPLTIQESDSNSETICLRATNSGGNGSQPGIVMKTAAGGHIGGIYCDVNSDYMRLSTSGTDRVFITNTGLVGVNCTPLAQFQVKSGTNQNIALSSMSSEAAIEAFNDAGSANVPLRLRASVHKFFIGSTEGLRVHTNGLIGVGHDSPTAYGRMTVAMPSQSGGAAIQVANSSLGSGDGTTSNIILRSVNNNGNNWADAEYRASQHIFAIQGSEKVRISSGGLAINKTSAADAEIEILQSADPTLRLYDTRNAAYKADFMMAGSGPLIRNNNTTASDRTLVVQKGTTDHLVIEGNGAVRKPLTPSFFSRPPGGYNFSSVQVSPIGGTWSDVHNIGSHFSNGTFTAPVAGTYQFTWSIFSQSETTRLDAFILVNGTNVMREEINGYPTTPANKSGSVHGCYYLSANDYVTFGVYSAGSTNIYVNAAPWTYASGFLVG